MDRLARIILISGFVLCATVNSFYAETIDYSVEVRTLISGIMALSLFIILAVRARLEDLLVLRNPLFIAYAFYWLIVTYSLCLAGNIGEAVYGSVKVFTLGTLLFAAVIILRNDHRFAKVLIIVTIALGVLVVYQFCFNVPEKRFGLMVGKNLNSAAFFLLGIMCIYFWSRWKVPATIAIVLSLFAIVSLRTRSIWLAVFIAGSIYVVTNRKYVLYGLVLIPMALGLSWVFIDTMGGINTSSMEQRVDTWTQTARMIRDYPMGVGSGNWQVVFPVYSGNLKPIHRAAVYNRKFYTQNHNDFQQQFAEVGIIGGLSYLLIFVIALWYGCGVIRAGIIGYIVFACFSFPAERAFHSLILMILFSYSVRPACDEYIKYVRPLPVVKWRPVLTVLTAGVLIFSVYDFAVRYESSRQTRRIYLARIDQQWKTIVTETRRISPLANIDPQSTTPLLFYRGLGYFYQGKLDRAVLAFEGAQKANPNHLYSVMNMAYCYVLTSELDKADEYYARARKMYPDFEDIDKAMHAMDALTGRLIGEGT